MMVTACLELHSLCQLMEKYVQIKLGRTSSCSKTMTQNPLPTQQRTSFGRKSGRLLTGQSQSPDLNPTEHAFYLLKRSLKGKKPKTNNNRKSLQHKHNANQILSVIYFHLLKYSLFQYFCSPSIMTFQSQYFGLRFLSLYSTGLLNVTVEYSVLFYRLYKVLNAGVPIIVAHMVLLKIKQFWQILFSQNVLELKFGFLSLSVWD